MDETIRTFGECLEIAKQCKTDNGNPPKKHLMLGNGFSIAIFPNIFNYKALSQNTDSSQVKNLFKLLDTNDFEYVMRRLWDVLELVKLYREDKDIPNKKSRIKDASELLDLYPENKKISDKLHRISENHLKIRKMLIDVVSELNPETPNCIVGKNYKRCYKFLEHFNDGNKYTFNYDLLLYWAYMKFRNDDKYKELEHDDGFRGNGTLTRNTNRGENQNIYYLHGAMHLFDDNGIVQKTRFNILSIKEQVRYTINGGKYPIFIAEGTKEEKLNRIQDCNYLKHAFDSLNKIDNNLFIFGHSLGNTDDHVFERVNSLPELKNIFISIFDDAKPNDKKNIIDKVRRWKIKNPDKRYFFYNTKSTDLWEPQEKLKIFTQRYKERLASFSKDRYKNTNKKEREKND